MIPKSQRDFVAKPRVAMRRSGAKSERYPGYGEATTSTLKGLRSGKAILTTAVSLFLAACTFAQSHRIVIEGGDWQTKHGPELQQMLGKDYEVIYSNRHSGPGYAGYVPPKLDAVLYDFTSTDMDWNTWAKNEDVFIYRVRTLIPEMGNFTLLLPPSSGSKIYEQDYVPLMRQIAREKNIKVADLSKSSDPAKDLYLQLATFQRNPGTWKLISAISEQTDEGPAKNAIDNNPDTYWHTRYDPNPTKVPHEIIIDLGKTQSLNGFSYLARQDGGVNGRVKDYEIYVSDDQANWGEPALKGTLQNSMNEQRLLFPKPATGRYLKFIALDEVNGNIWTSIAELGILPTGNAK